MSLPSYLSEPRLLQDTNGNLVPADQITGPSGSPRQRRDYGAEAEGQPDTLRLANMLCPVDGCDIYFRNRGNLTNHLSARHPGNPCVIRSIGAVLLIQTACHPLCLIGWIRLSGWMPPDQLTLNSTPDGAPLTLPRHYGNEALLVDYSESDGDEEGEDSLRDGRRGSAKRKSCKIGTKHAVLTRYDELLAVAIQNGHETDKGSGWLTAAYMQLQSEFGEIPIPNLSKWTQIVEVRNRILEEAAKPGGQKKTKAGSGAKAKWPGMEKLLALAVRKRRDKGLKVRTSWLVRKGKELIKKLNGSMAAVAFKGSSSWVRGFARRNNLSQRRGTNHKNKSASARLPMLWRFHKGLRSLLRTEGSVPDQRSLKHGRYPLRCRFNVDQIPLAFDMGAGTTWETTGVKRCWIKKHLAGLDKRFCTIQLCISSEANLQGKQPVKICIIFRSNSKGRRIKKSEIARYDRRVAILWQKKAWADRETCLEWAKNVYRRGTSRCDDKVLFMDNLDGQTNEEFVRYLEDECETKSWYGPAGCTDHWQPVDSHIGFLLKQLIVNEYEEMMEERGDEWEDGKISLSEKRVFVTQWVARAWEVMQTKHAHLISKAFTRTGCGSL